MGNMQRWASVLAVWIVASGTVALSQTVARANAQDEESGSVSPQLVGTWKAVPERIALTSDFDKSVWGEHASSVREVALTIQPSGEGTLTVTRKVVDARGRAKPASTSIEEARIVVGGPQETVGPRVEHRVTVLAAERRYPDDPKDTWKIEGLRVRVVTFSDQDDTLEVRFDTPEGRGSFWETLRREGRRSARRAAR